jgi:hypothetical protein
VSKVRRWLTKLAAEWRDCCSFDSFRLANVSDWPATPLKPATDGAFYALSVRNIDKAVAWYTKHLGFKLESQGGNDQRRGALLSRPGAVLELGQFAAAVAQEEMRGGRRGILSPCHGL